MRIKYSTTQGVITKTSAGTFFSDYFQVDEDVIEEYGALNVSLVADLPLFIDPFLLFNSTNKQYRQLHDDIIKYLHFLKNKSITQKMDVGALKAWYSFHEVEQNWLGFSVLGNRGSGLGTDFAKALKSARCTWPFFMTSLSPMADRVKSGASCCSCIAI